MIRGEFRQVSHRWWTFGLAGMALVFSMCPAVWAQKKPAAQEATAEESGDAAETPDGDAPKTNKKGPPRSEAQKAFDEKFKEWKAVIVDLRKMRLDFSTATPEVREKLRADWNESVAKGSSLLGELRTIGLKAMTESDVPDAQLIRFMESLVSEAAASDNYEVAYAIGKPVLEKLDQIGETPGPITLAAIGSAAYCMNDFDFASATLKRGEAGEQLGADANPAAKELIKKGVEYLAAIPVIQKKWEKENEIREAETAKDDLPRVKIETTAGTMVVELYENEAPETVGNFVSLVEKGFYKGLTFHRVLPFFMAQGGCPRGDGTGDPGYKIYDECTKADSRKHFRGVLSMANAGPDTGGSQFFINFVPTPQLDGRHTVFGRVVEGIDVLSKIQRINPEAPSATKPTKIIGMEVVRKRDHEYAPRKVE